MLTTLKTQASIVFYDTNPLYILYILMEILFWDAPLGLTDDESALV